MLIPSFFLPLPLLALLFCLLAVVLFNFFVGLVLLVAALRSPSPARAADIAANGIHSPYYYNS